MMKNIKRVSDLRNYTEDLQATIKLLSALEEGEQKAREEGWLSAEQVETRLKNS